MAVALRPDLHQAPIPRASMSQSGYAGDLSSAPASSGGMPMPAAVQAKMEQAFGADFSGVRIHQGSQAQMLGALAFTQGTDIHMAQGQYDPFGRRGQELLGHELAHVIQQSQGRVRGTMQAMGVAVNDDASLEREADELGAQAARGERTRDQSRAASATRTDGAVTQRAIRGSSATPVLQAKWLKDEGTLMRWDAAIKGLTWYYDTETDKLFYDDGEQRSSAHSYQEWLQIGWPGLADKELEEVLSKEEVRRMSPEERKLWQRNQYAVKGREKLALTDKNVKNHWEGVKDRKTWDQKFEDEYRPNMSFDDRAPAELKKDLGLPHMLREGLIKNDEKLLHQYYELANEGESTGLKWEAWLKAAREQKEQILALNPYAREHSFKVGWKGSVVDNDRLRQQQKPHGSYTGTLNLGTGTLVASGSYRKEDSLNQNEIIYQIWREAHELHGLDFWNNEQFKPLLTVVRHNVVNEQLRPLFDVLGEGEFRPGQLAFDALLATPNVGAVLFVIKDRGKELGIKGISKIVIDKGSATIHLEQTKRVLD